MWRGENKNRKNLGKENYKRVKKNSKNGSMKYKEKGKKKVRVNCKR